VELAPSGIRVNVVWPGVISTPGSDEFSKAHPEFSPADWIRSIPLGRIGAPEDIAEAVALLVSDRAKFITGANYRVDGGMTGAWRMCRKLASSARTGRDLMRYEEVWT